MKNKYFITIMMLLAGVLSAQTLDINTFTNMVRKNNKDIMIAMNELDIAEQNKVEARAGAFPQINAEAGYKRNITDSYLYVEFPGMPGTQKFSINYNNEFNFQTVLSQQIFNYTVFNAIKASKQYEKLSGFAYDATFQGVIAGSKKAFYQALLLKEVYKVKKQAEENAKDNYDDVKKKYDQGIVSQFELYQAQVRWQNRIPETTQAKRNFNIALNALKTLAGIEMEKVIDVTGTFEDIPDLPNEMAVKSIFQLRPDFNALRWKNNLLRTNIEVEKSGWFPMLYGTVVYNYSSQSDQFKFDRENNLFFAGLTLKVPIFSGLSTKAKVEKARIEVNKSNLEIEKKKDDIYREIKNIRLRLTESEERIAAAQKTIETAERAFKIAETSAENGIITQLELKDARFGYDQAKLNLISANYDYLSSYFDWELATGRVE